VAIVTGVSGRSQPGHGIAEMIDVNDLAEPWTAPLRCFPTFSAIELRGCPAIFFPHWKEPNREAGT
jgi:hypothetical protein